LISSLRLENLRSIRSATLVLNPKINILEGENGSGKTTILEGISMLSMGRSFITPRHKSLIRFGETKSTVYTSVKDKNNLPFHIGVSFEANGARKIRLNSLNVKSQAAISRYLPCLTLAPSVTDIVSGSPINRRRLMDWGVFHVEKAPIGLFTKFRRVLAQRNAMLRNKIDYSVLSSWNEQFVELSMEIDKHRRMYVEKFVPLFIKHQRQLGISFELKIDYNRGWNEKKDLHDVLSECMESDISSRFSSAGPHKADLVIKRDGVLASDALSRGQLKVIYVASVFAQLDTCASNNLPVILIDDLASELDKNSQSKVWSAVNDCGAQCLITDLGGVDRYFSHQKTMFHVKHGFVT